MSLPVPNLDDRKFQDIVDEAKRLIPTFCPEWTNHNLSDPGVALIELFAWMTEMTLFRLNQVPDAFYTRHAQPARVRAVPGVGGADDLTFWLVGAGRAAGARPGRHRGRHDRRASGELRVFTHAARPVHRQAGADGGPDCIRAATPTSTCGRTSALKLSSVSASPTVTPGECFYLGFERSLAGNALRLEIAANVEGIGVMPDRPPLVWEVWQGEGWIPATVPTSLATVRRPTRPAASTATATCCCSYRTNTSR